MEGLADVIVAGIARSTPDHGDNVTRLEFGAAVAHGVAQHPLDPVTPDGVGIDFAGHGETQPRCPFAGKPVQGHQGFGHTACAIEDR